MTPEMEDFIRAYVEVYITRHTERSLGQIKHVLNQAMEEGENELEALQARFDEWSEKRPGKIADEETVRINGAVFTVLAVAAGVTHLTWRAAGAKTCPFCQQLDGVVVGIERDFIADGEAITASDGSGMKVYGPKAHPPIHQGCECYIEASK